MPVVPLQTVIAHIALGSNLGDRRANIDAALCALAEADGIELLQTSTLFETAAVGGPADSPAFLNAAAEIQTTLSPRQLLQTLLHIESSLGRVRRQKWEPRLIDLDLLLYGEQIIDAPDLHVPHPLMHERLFVLQPLAQIAPQAIHPHFGQTISQLLNRA